ncbi:related to transformer-2 protein homolog [Phaffia rhodozyma]|uniref:Related to transformer-2 protein homolog n=1 Tax=Phaffia rhodozyma TaxID=264483 RepID=A0A0F7SMX7_PHARH|nr:related to transformer-2 protein homolog [Phaffia rhodozyma]
MSDTDEWATRDEPAAAQPSHKDDYSRGGTPPPRGRDRRSASPSGDNRGGGRMDVDRPDRGRGDGPPRSGGDENPGNNLHVSSLSPRVEQRDLETAFSKFGVIDKIQIMYDPHSRESRGFAFVTMATPEEADAAIAGLDGVEFMGKPMRIGKARRGRARTPTPGRYFGPPKEDDRRPPRRDYGSRGGERERPYDPQPYDARYSSGPPVRARPPPYDDRRGDRRDERYDPRGGYRSERDYPPRDYAPRDYPPRDPYGYPSSRDRYEDRPYVPSSTRSSGPSGGGGGYYSAGPDYGAPPPPPVPRRDRRQDELYATPAAGYDRRDLGDRDGGRRW